MKHKLKMNIQRIIAVALTMVMMFGMFTVYGFAASAKRPLTIQEFTDRPVEEDLADIVTDYETYPDKPYNNSLYGENAISATLKFIRIFEYGFNEEDFDNYGLFLYLYDEDGAINPSMKEHLSIGQNMVVEIGKVEEYYSNFRCVDISEDGRFLKFALDTEICETIYNDTVDPFNDRGWRYNRQYSFQSVLTPLYYGVYSFQPDYSIIGTYEFSGYQDGFHYYSASLDPFKGAIAEEKKIVQLEAYSTYWRTESSVGDNNLRKQINSIYFIVPDIVDNYSHMEYLKMKYEEYRTKPCLYFTPGGGSNQFQNYLYDYSNEDYLWNENWKPQFRIRSHDHIDIPDPYFPQTILELSYNIETGRYVHSDYEMSTLNWWFSVLDIDKPVSRDEIYSYLRSEEAKGLYYENEPSEIQTSKYIYKDDFEIVGKLEGYGYSDFMTKVNDFGLEAFFRDWGWFGLEWDETKVEDVKPIIEFSDKTFLNEKSGQAMSDEELCDFLKVSERDIDHIKALHEEAKAENGHLVLARFDVSDYKCWDVVITGYGNLANVTPDEARIDIQSYYKDIEILEMGLMNEAQELIVVEVDMVPIDLIGDGNTPAIPTVNKPMPNFKALLSLLLGVVAILVVTPIVAKFGSEVFGWVFKKRKK